jgi:hypothetical protein
VKTYKVVFERIGRHRQVPPLDVTTDPATAVRELTLAVLRTARKYVISRGVDVDIDSHMTGGTITVGDRACGSFRLFQVAEPPVLDANGDPVEVSAAIEVSDGFRRFMAGRVPVDCGHYIAASEARTGMKSCERCSFYMSSQETGGVA